MTYTILCPTMMFPSKNVWMVLNSKQESGGTKHCEINYFQTVYYIRFMIQQTVMNAAWQKVLANGGEIQYKIRVVHTSSHIVVFFVVKGVFLHEVNFLCVS